MLASKIIGPVSGVATKVVYVLHGLLGSSRNWQSFVKSMSAESPSTEFVCVDLRNHGHSKGFQAPHTLDSCADDILRYAKETGKYPSAMIGHSLGGKILLKLASRDSDMRDLASHSPDASLSMYVVDSAPGLKSTHAAAASDSVEKVLKIVEAAPIPIPSKSWILDVCDKNGLEKTVALWLATNIVHLDGKTHGESEGKAAGFHWLFDPATAAALYDSYTTTDTWDVLVDGPIKEASIELIMATKSSRWKDAHTVAKIAETKAAAASRAATTTAHRGNVTLSTVHSGHWVHAENPTALQHLIMSTLK